MTTSTFGTPVAQAPGTTGPADQGEDAPSSRRTVTLLAAIAAALALGAGIYFLLLSGGEADAVAAPLVKAPAVVAPAAAPSAAPTPVTKQKAVKARNPFVALVVLPAQGSDGSPSGATGVVSGAVPVSGSSPPLPVVPVAQVPVTRAPVTRVPVSSVPVGPVPAAPSPITVVGAVPVTPGAPAAPSRPIPVTVKLAAVSADNTVALLTVAGKAVRVKAGAEFGTDYRLLNLRDGSCGAVQLGSVVVDLCEGKSYTTR